MELTKLNSVTMPHSKSNHQNYAVSRMPYLFKQISYPFHWMKHFRIVTCVAIITIISTLYALWPTSNHDVGSMQVVLSHVKIDTSRRESIDMALNVTVEVNNMATMHTLDYTALEVVVEYRGTEIGHVLAKGGGHVRETGSSYVDAVVELQGVALDSNWIHLLEDYAKGCVRFDTIAKLDGFFSFVFQIPLKAKYICKIDVDIESQAIINQICEPTAIEFGFSFSFPIPFLPLGLMQIEVVIRI